MAKNNLSHSSCFSCNSAKEENRLYELTAFTKPQVER